jgi:hypothetical protein
MPLAFVKWVLRMFHHRWHTERRRLRRFNFAATNSVLMCRFYTRPTGNSSYTRPLLYEYKKVVVHSA